MTLSGAGVQQTSQESASAHPLPPRGPSPDSGEVTSGSEVFRAGVRAPACWLCEARGTKPESKGSRPLAERSSTPLGSRSRSTPPNRASALSLSGPPRPHRGPPPSRGAGALTARREAGPRAARGGPPFRTGPSAAPPASGARPFRAEAPGRGPRCCASGRRGRRPTGGVAGAMASGRVRGPTPRWGLAVGGAALFLLLLPAAAAQGEGSRRARGRGGGGAGVRGGVAAEGEAGGSAVSGSWGAEGRRSQPLWVAAPGPRRLRPGGHPSVGSQPGAAGLGDGGGPALCPGSACGVVRDRGVGLAERSGATTLGKSRLGCGLGVESRAGELACPTAGRRPESRGRAPCAGAAGVLGALLASRRPVCGPYTRHRAE